LILHQVTHAVAPVLSLKKNLRQLGDHIKGPIGGSSKQATANGKISIFLS